MKALFDKTSILCSRKLTHNYSTSFSLGIRMLGAELRDPIYAIYGFVRVADEIVDSFHDYDKKTLLDEFKNSTYQSIDRGISTNPILNSFQEAVNRYNIDHSFIEAFFNSMYSDLDTTSYNKTGYEEYIYGSAQVVGLMCLKVFVNGKQKLFDDLKDGAEALGAAFQKVNFLRDYNADKQALGREYFPNLEFDELDDKAKKEIEKDIDNDFNRALVDIVRLPKSARFGVYTAYLYYVYLFKKIKRSPTDRVLNSRIRINNFTKLMLLLFARLDLQIKRFRTV